MSGSVDISFRQIQEDDLAEVLGWIEKENWTTVNLKELKQWYKLYPESFLGAYDSAGQLQSHIFNRRLNEDSYVIEMFISRPECRGKGIGGRLLQHVIHLNSTCNTVLVSVLGKENFYQRNGLKYTGQKMLRMYRMKPLLDSKPELKEEPGLVVEQLNGSKLQDVIQYDKTIYSKNNDSLIQFCFESKDCVCVCAYIQETKCVVGYIVIKQTSAAYKIAAFCADTPGIAKHLLAKALSLSSNLDCSLYFYAAFEKENLANCLDAYGGNFENHDIDFTKKEESFLSTTGKLDEKIVWSKIYGVSELGYVSFA